MTNELCKCGHTKAEHSDYIERLDVTQNRPYREYVTVGFGKCQKCNCDYFKK